MGVGSGVGRASLSSERLPVELLALRPARPARCRHPTLHDSSCFCTYTHGPRQSPFWATDADAWKRLQLHGRRRRHRTPRSRRAARAWGPPFCARAFATCGAGSATTTLRAEAPAPRPAVGRRPAIKVQDRWSACRGPGAARKALLGFIAPPPLPNVQWYWHQAPAFAFGAGSARPKASRVSPRAAGPAPRRKHSTGVRPRNGCPAQKCPRSTLEGKFC